MSRTIRSKNYRPEVMYKSLSSYELPRDIGAVWEYSNFGVGLLGQCLARKAGRPYEELVLERICRPLSMNSTCVTLSPELRKRLAQGYSEPGRPAEPWELAAVTPAGGIRSSANDMMSYLAAQMGTLSTPLTPATEMSHVVRTPTDTDDTKQALGWLVMKLPDTPHGTVWHNGGTGGYACWASFVKETKIGVIVLSNCASGSAADLIGVALASSLDRQASAATSSSAPAE